MQVELATFNGGPDAPPWNLGPVRALGYCTAEISAYLSEQKENDDIGAVLFWDARLGSPPSAERIRELLDSPFDVWHAGLPLGTSGLPAVLPHYAPIWTLGADPEPDLEATSWRLSFRACLVRNTVLRHFSPPSPAFATPRAGALEWGYRLIRRGAFMRHVPDLIPESAANGAPIDQLPVADELKFARLVFTNTWFLWASVRTVLEGHFPRLAALTAAFGASGLTRRPFDPPFRPEGVATVAPSPPADPPKITVLLPTINRYPYLRPLIEQLGAQTIKPHQVIVIDQSDAEVRQRDLADDFPDVPVLYLEQDEPGQCSSRNRGLMRATGEYVLFLDDDDEIQPDLIELHLRAFEKYRCDASCGVADEAGIDELPPEFSFVRASDVFPTNNCMVRRSCLEASGLFDLAYDRGKRADADLGARVYLSGANLVLDPSISVFHHRAPMGGLRTHGQRVVTRASSRARITHMNLASAFDCYITRRYQGPRNIRELLWISAFASLRMQGSLGLQLAKLTYGLLMMPRTVWRLLANDRAALGFLREFPQFPQLGAVPPTE